MKPMLNVLVDKASTSEEAARRRIVVDIRHSEKKPVDQFRKVVDQLSGC